MQTSQKKKMLPKNGRVKNTQKEERTVTGISTIEKFKCCPPQHCVRAHNIRHIVPHSFDITHPLRRVGYGLIPFAKFTSVLILINTKKKKAKSGTQTYAQANSKKEKKKKKTKRPAGERSLFVSRTAIKTMHTHHKNRPAPARAE